MNMKKLTILVTPRAAALALLLFGTAAALYAQAGPGPWRAANAAVFGDQTVNTIAGDGKGRWLAGGLGVIGYSDDGGVTWTKANVSAVFGNVDVSGIATDGRGHWVAVGSGAGRTVRYGYSSDNGVTWINSTPRFRSGALYGIATDGAGRWAAVGTGGVEYSADGGSSWEKGNSGSAFRYTLMRIATDGKGRWLVGDEDGTISYSTDGGASWTAGKNSRDMRPASFFGVVIAIATDKTGRWVAVKMGTATWTNDKGQNETLMHGQIGYSTDGGATWTAADTSTVFVDITPMPLPENPRYIDRKSNLIRAIATDGRGRWVAGGSGGNNAAYSTNGGAAWTAANASGVFGTGRYDGIRAIATDGKGRWVAVGENGKIAYMDWR
jgi:photosystem II stability/assembly factor-like uncharacterized protein